MNFFVVVVGFLLFLWWWFLFVFVRLFSLLEQLREIAPYYFINFQKSILYFLFTPSEYIQSRTRGKLLCSGFRQWAIRCGWFHIFAGPQYQLAKLKWEREWGSQPTAVREERNGRAKGSLEKGPLAHPLAVPPSVRPWLPHHSLVMVLNPLSG